MLIMHIKQGQTIHKTATESQREKEAAMKADAQTKRKKYRETNKQRDKQTKGQTNKETKKQRN